MLRPAVAGEPWRHAGRRRPQLRVFYSYEMLTLQSLRAGSRWLNAWHLMSWYQWRSSLSWRISRGARPARLRWRMCCRPRLSDLLKGASLREPVWRPTDKTHGNLCLHAVAPQAVSAPKSATKSPLEGGMKRSSLPPVGADLYSCPSAIPAGAPTACACLNLIRAFSRRRRPRRHQAASPRHHRHSNPHTLTAIYDTLIIATAERAPDQASRATCPDKGRAAGGHVILTEGRKAGEWVLVDCADMVVHIMLPTTRALYNPGRTVDAADAGEIAEG